ncbi:MAG: GNAT family N-acetyltransferase, partial [Saprospiraceae bacterium]
MTATLPSAAIPKTFSVRVATMDDIPAVVSLLNTCSALEVGIKLHDEAEMKLEWTTTGFDLTHNTQLVFAPDGQLAAVATTWMVRNPPVHPWVQIRVHPDFTGLGLGTTLTRWGEARARTAIACVPVGARVAMRCGVSGGYAPAVAFLEDYGMQQIRHFWDMEIKLDALPPAPKFPDGITMVRFRFPQDLERTYLAFDEAFEDHWGHVSSPPEEGIARWCKWVGDDPDFDPDIWFLAMDGDEIAGVSLCYNKIPHDPNMAWVDILGVRKPWRK